MLNDYISLSTRSGFNKSLNHFRIVTEVLNLIREGVNTADVVEELERETMIRKEQILPVLNSILVEKFFYRTISFNLTRHIKDADQLYSILSKWNKFDTVIAYHHPQLGISLINPQNKTHWENIGGFTREELVVIYVRALDYTEEGKEEKILHDYKKVFLGKTVGNCSFYNKVEKEYVLEETKSDLSVVLDRVGSPPIAKDPPQKIIQEEKEIQEPPPPPKRKMTPKYSVQVTNDLFHNGNVEAWKNVIESYQLKYPSTKVYIFHDGKQVNNLNSLFKWGKVNHGDVVLFSVVGESFKDISKIQRYLFEGASNRFKVFMKKDVNKVLNLF